MTRRVLVYLAVMAGIAVFSGLMIFLIGNSIRVSCVRPADEKPTCTVTTILLGVRPTSSRIAAGVTRVQMEENCDDGCSYRALLLTSNGEGVPINEVYTDEGPVSRQIEAVDRFLSGTGTSFEYLEPVTWWAVILIACMDLVGVGIAVGIFLKESARG
jgi:hypothetical protein